MNKVILTAPNGKVYITKTKYDINDSFYSLAPSIKDSNRFFKEKDLKFIKETLMPKGRVTAIDGMQSSSLKAHVSIPYQWTEEQPKPRS